MRTAAVAVLVVLSLTPAARSANAGDVTVLLEFEQPQYSAIALHAMQTETQSILAGSGVKLAWSVPRRAAGTSGEGSIVVFRMKGKCAMDFFPALPDELGLPLAMAHSSDGIVLPFGEVDCERVRRSVRSALRPPDHTRAEPLLGRALGRVVAHEIYHMLARSHDHDREGIARERLSVRDLTRERFTLSEESLRAIRAQIGLVKSQKGSAGLTTPDGALP